MIGSEKLQVYLPVRHGTDWSNVEPRLRAFPMMTIMVLFHSGNFSLKHFYLFYVKPHLKSEFPQTVSYNRFVELQQKAVLPMALFLKMCCLGKCTGIFFIDSTPFRSCHIKKEKQYKDL